MMFRYNKNILALTMLAVAGMAMQASARPNINSNPKSGVTGQLKTTASTCKSAEANIDLDINNVRARLMTGGDMWWDIGTTDARYEIPKGSKKNSLFAGSVWIGGKDAQGQLKVAAQTYRQDGNDYWPGPLDESANVSSDVCSDWDRFWKVNRSDINKFRELGSWPVSLKDDATYEAITQWPAKGNQYALGATKNNLGLLEATRDYAPFVDVDADGKYDFTKGDYPKITGDQFIWWVFNDKGNVKQQSQTEGIGVEVQASAFGYSTKDFLNDATFYNFRLINRSNSSLDSTYIATWTDADLGYYADDYIGCDTTRGLGILYNGKSEDGSGQPNSYGTKIPMVGVDFFKGPLKPYDTFENGVKKTKYKQLGMESFTYYNNDNTIIGNPNNGAQIYFYMTGSIRTGQRFTNDFQGPNVNSKGYGTGSPTNFLFTGNPDIKTEWSECSCNNPVADRRFVHSAGPFKLESGVVNDITIGAVWVSDVGGCPNTSFKKIRVADDLAQGLFDNNFETIEGPEAPRMVARELNRKLVFYLINDPASNNYQEKYGYDLSEKKYRVPSVKASKYLKSPDSLYKFEGYRVFQLKNSSVTAAQIFNDNGEVNQELATQVFQCDIRNNIKRIINYDKKTEVSDTTFVPQIKVEGVDSGIKHSFVIELDQFANGSDKKLINYHNYYFVAIAYAYNDFSYDVKTKTGGFNPKKPDSTQDMAYIESSHGAGGTPISIVTAMPNPANGDMGTELNSEYGSGVVIKRIEGTGNGGNEIELSQESENIALNYPYQDINPVYKAGKGPVKVKIVDPVKVVPGNWELYIVGKTGPEPGLGMDDHSWWKLVNTTTGETILSEVGIKTRNEQIIEKYGLSVEIAQTLRPGDDQENGNGYITSSIRYSDTTKPWLSGVPDGESRSFLNWIRSGGQTDTSTFCDFNDRPGVGYDTIIQIYEKLLPNDPGTRATWAPYTLAAVEDRDRCGFGVAKALTASSGLYNLPSVDVVLTSDKSKWTRCPVLELHDEAELTEGKSAKFDLRGHDGWNMQIDAAGRPVYSTDPQDRGMSWFPGYAINHETGERLNLMFGEDSWLKQANGTDMIWNPTTELFSANGNVIFGGKHYVYILNSRYDSCRTFLNAYRAGSLSKNNAYRNIQWVGTTMLKGGYQLKSLADGLIPNDVRIKFRVTRPYGKYISNLEPAASNASLLRNGGFPLYSFSTDALAPTPVKDNANLDKKKLLERIQAVPNPYYAYSGYEGNRLDSRVRIINLPGRATISIYSLDGSLIRRLEKDNANVSYIDWDIRNEKGLPIASGMYLMHVEAQGIGETVVKWFGAMRPLDVTSN